MVNIIDAWNKINTCLNVNLKKINPNYKFIKANLTHNLPPYPYATTNILVAYVQDKDDFRATTKDKANTDGTVTTTRVEEPKMTLSFTFYSGNMAEMYEFMQNTVNALKTTVKQELSDNDIIILRCSVFVDKTSILETEYVYKYGFDVQIRVMDVIEVSNDSIESAEIESTIENVIIDF